MFSVLKSALVVAPLATSPASQLPVSLQLPAASTFQVPLAAVAISPGKEEKVTNAIKVRGKFLKKGFL